MSEDHAQTEPHTDEELAQLRQARFGIYLPGLGRRTWSRQRKQSLCMRNRDSPWCAGSGGARGTTPRGGRPPTAG